MCEVYSVSSLFVMTKAAYYVNIFGAVVYFA